MFDVVCVYSADMNCMIPIRKYSSNDTTRKMNDGCHFTNCLVHFRYCQLNRGNQIIKCTSFDAVTTTVYDSYINDLIFVWRNE